MDDSWVVYILIGCMLIVAVGLISVTMYDSYQVDKMCEHFQEKNDCSFERCVLKEIASENNLRELQICELIKNGEHDE